MVIYVFTLRRVCYLTGESMYGKDYGHACGDSMRISRGLLEMYAVCASRSYCTSFWVRMGQSTFFRHGVTTGKLERVKEQRDTNEEDDRQFDIMAKHLYRKWLTVRETKGCGQTWPMALITDYKKQSKVVICSDVARLGAVQPRTPPPLLWGGQHSKIF